MNESPVLAFSTVGGIRHLNCNLHLLSSARPIYCTFECFLETVRYCEKSNMENADEIGDVVRTEAHMSSTKQESTDYPFARLRGVHSRMNLYVEKVENLRRLLEESEKSIKLLQEQNALMETAHSEKRPQQAVDGTGDAPSCPPALLDHIEELEEGLENRLQQLEQLLERRRRVVHVGVQTDVGEADLAKLSHSRRSWWPAAAIVLSSTSVSLVIAGLLNSVWAGGLDEVVIHIDPQSL